MVEGGACQWWREVPTNGVTTFQCKYRDIFTCHRKVIKLFLFFMVYQTTKLKVNADTSTIGRHLPICMSMIYPRVMVMATLYTNE